MPARSAFDNLTLDGIDDLTVEDMVADKIDLVTLSRLQDEAAERITRDQLLKAKIDQTALEVVKADEKNARRRAGKGAMGQIGFEVDGVSVTIKRPTNETVDQDAANDVIKTMKAARLDSRLLFAFAAKPIKAALQNKGIPEAIRTAAKACIKTKAGKPSIEIDVPSAVATAAE